MIELGRPLVVALNMMDIAERRGLKVSPENLANELGVPVIPVVGSKKKGIAELKAAILKATVAPLPELALPEPMKRRIARGRWRAGDIGQPMRSGDDADG